MVLELHPDFQMQTFQLGSEKAPLVVIDNVVADPEQLIKPALDASFVPGGRFYPGIRAHAPTEYQRFIAQKLGRVLLDAFELKGTTIGFSMCHYSLVTVPPNQLEVWQRMPHIDSVNQDSLAAVHYLFKGNLGGTAFYRHRRTGFEIITEARQQAYFSALKGESADPAFPGAGYINGDNTYFEQIAAQDGIFNRMLVYRRNSLHSGSIDAGFVPDPNPGTGRLSINSFIDVV